ncbi:MAG: DHA2 family efflux MFS transporter permease subunit [Solirubrobacteraceae bacterium]|nr:DHA2 family efflux MFS transporter permease subunit [Solirubrobacteraceae bacterium]
MSAAPTHPPADRRRLALVAAILGSFVVGLDSTVVNVALPAISGDLGGGLAGQQWVSNAYLLALGSLILIGGSLGDVYGERRVFTLGVAGFGLASVICAAAPSIELLVLARGLQGVFGALLTPAALAVIIAVFPPDERGAAIGSWTAWQAISGVIGPFAGGWLIDQASWRWIFAINVPFVILTIVLVAIAVPGRGEETVRRRVDWPGAVLGALGLAGPVFALIRQPAVGWSSAEVYGPLLGGLGVFALFLLHEARAKDPMLPLGLFRRRNFSAGNLETLVMYGGLSITFFFLVLFLQQVAGYSALEAGITTLPVTLVMFALSKRFGALADRFGPRAFMGGGPLIAAVGLAWLTRAPAQVDYVVDLLPALLLFAIGLSITVAPLSAAVLADADEHNAGIASATNNAVARVAGLVAIAGLGAVIAGSFSGAIDRELADQRLTPAAAAVVEEAKSRTLATADVSSLEGGEARLVAQAAEAASLDAFHEGMGIAAVLVALGGVIGIAGIRNPRRVVKAEDCSGGQLVGAPRDAGRGPLVVDPDPATA